MGAVGGTQLGYRPKSWYRSVRHSRSGSTSLQAAGRGNGAGPGPGGAGDSGQATKRPAKGSSSRSAQRRGSSRRRPVRGNVRDSAASPATNTGPTTATLLVPFHASASNVQVHNQAQARATNKYISSYSSSSLSSSSASSFPKADCGPDDGDDDDSRNRDSGHCDADTDAASASSGCRIPLGVAPPIRTPPPALPLVTVVPPSPGRDSYDNSTCCDDGCGHDQPPREAKRPIMQRVSAFLPSWDKRNSSRSSFFGWSSNRSSTSGPAALAKINTTAANGRVHREAFWPVTLDGECDKAARILRSFSTDGYLAPADDREISVDAEPRTPIHVTKKIPRRIIQNAAGIAVFTCMRSGLWMTGSGGSGILIARKSDGTWSPPSGIMLHTPTLSFIIGVDIYDCVLVVNNLAALESITKPRVTLGEDVGLTSGPLVPLDSDEADIKWKDLGNTVLTYMKARGQTQDVNLNGCILAERSNENERFYSSGVTQMDILAGNVARHVEETKPLFEVIKMAEGRTDYDPAVIEKCAMEPAPSDAVIATPKSSTPASPATAFGIPNVEDPDPFGVLALEMAGLEIREAGSRLRPASSQFEFNPSPMSPAFSKYNRQSMDTYMSKSNRGSYMSSRTVKSQMTDAGTQTSVGNTPETTPSPSQSEDGRDRTTSSQMPDVTEEEEEVDYTKVDLTPLRHISGSHSVASVTAAINETTVVEQDKLKVDDDLSKDDIDKRSKASSIYDREEQDDEDNKPVSKEEKEGEEEEEDEEDEDEEEEEPVVFEVAAVQPARTQAVASRMIHAKGNMVTIPKRVPPPLPMRSAARISRSSKSDMGDVSGLRSPLRQTHSQEDLNDDAVREETSKEELPSENIGDKKMQDKPVEDKSDDSEAEFFPAEETKAEEPEAKKTTSEEKDSREEELKPEVNGIEDKGDDKTLDIPQPEQRIASESVADKHTSSIYTGGASERWSCDGSSLTTPTSDRPFSVVDEGLEDKTPKKQIIEEETDLTKNQADDEKTEPEESKPSTIAVA